jgi:hypothetical protein
VVVAVASFVYLPGSPFSSFGGCTLHLFVRSDETPTKAAEHLVTGGG